MNSFLLYYFSLSFVIFLDNKKKKKKKNCHCEEVCDISGYLENKKDLYTTAWKEYKQDSKSIGNHKIFAKADLQIVMMLPRMDSIEDAILLGDKHFSTRHSLNLDLETKTLLQCGMGQYAVVQIWTLVPHFIPFFAN